MRSDPAIEYNKLVDYWNSNVIKGIKFHPSVMNKHLEMLKAKETKKELKQLELCFGLTPGTSLYYDKYLEKYGEICEGGLVFEIGKKDSCKECARTCAGCMEMAVNFASADIKDVFHLISKPDMLNKQNLFKYNQLMKEKESHTGKGVKISEQL